MPTSRNLTPTKRNSSVFQLALHLGCEWLIVDVGLSFVVTGAVGHCF